MTQSFVNLFLILFFILMKGIENSRDVKRLSVFEVIRFKNEICETDEHLTGTCHTEEECLQLNGVPSGRCAQGFGICCYFQITCSQESSQNATYFVSSGSQSKSSCSVKICPHHSGICQLRLDFISFDIDGPSYDTKEMTRILEGSIHVKGTPVTQASQCLNENFSIRSFGGTSPPVICGQNSGAHMILGIDETCTVLQFHLKESSEAIWNIRISQIACDDSNKAPDGCTQYFTGNEGVLQSFNYESHGHLANQNQLFCIRRERGKCGICYTTLSVSDFSVSGFEASKGYNEDSKCCVYGANYIGYDCVLIPNLNGMESGFCGKDQGLAVDYKPATICSYSTPFQVRFLTDNFEALDEVKNGLNKGMKLMYSQKDC